MRTNCIARALAPFGFFCLFCQSACAGALTLVADDIVWNPPIDGAVSPALSFGVNNDTSPDLDRLQGWQLRLQIMPDTGAEGTLEFNARSLPTSDYLLEGASGGLGGSLSVSDVFAFDDDPGFLGVEVPLSGKQLLTVDFSTPDDARGNFKILAIPGLANTQWSDANFVDREFENVPLSASNPIVLATVTVVPEPSTALLACVGLASLLIVVTRSYSLKSRAR